MAALAGLVSVQTGAALGKSLFPLLGSDGVAALRVGLAALLLAAVLRPWRIWHTLRWTDLLGYGLTLGLMNLLIYRAFAHIPVSVAVSIEVVGPLGVALASSRQRLDVLWIGLSVLGLVLLPLGALGGELDLRGVACALAAGLCWALYMVTGARLAHGGAPAVASGMLVAAAVVLSSTLPYLLDMVAMRHLPARVFGVLLSASPAVSALAAWFVLYEALSLVQGLGVAAITLACAGSALCSQRERLP